MSKHLCCLRNPAILLLVLFCCFDSACVFGQTEDRPQLVLDADGFTGGRVSHLSISSDGRFLAAAAEKTVRVWDLDTFEPWCTLRGYQERQGHHIGVIDSMSFSHDGKFLTVGVSDNVSQGSTREYDLQNPEEIKTLIKGQGGCTRQIAYSHDSHGMFKATYG